MALELPFDEHAQNDNKSLEQSGKMLLLMAQMGMAKEAIAAMLEFATDGKLHKDHKRYLIAPVIQHKSPWIESTPKWLYGAITYDRLKIILEEHKKGKVGWQIGAAELTAILYPASMDSPMRHEAAQIYLYAAAHANARHYKTTIDEMWKRVGVQKIEDKDILDPKGRYHYEYKIFCQDIRRKLVKAGAERERTVKLKDVPDKKQPPPPSSNQQVQGIQLDLF